MANEEATWDESDREDLRNTLRRAVVGETRFARRDADEIIEFCREVYIDETAPDEEHAEFNTFVQLELNRFLEIYEREKASWPEKTDCDRLDAAEESLLKDGIVLWQASPCCDTCTMGEFQDHVIALKRAKPELTGKVRGYSFFIDQNMAENLSEGSEIQVYLAYGYEGDGEDIGKQEYKRRALAVGHELVDHLRKAGLTVEWDGDFSKKIRVEVNWKRREPLP